MDIDGYIKDYIKYINSGQWLFVHLTLCSSRISQQQDVDVTLQVKSYSHLINGKRTNNRGTPPASLPRNRFPLGNNLRDPPKSWPKIDDKESKELSKLLPHPFSCFCSSLFCQLNVPYFLAWPYPGTKGLIVKICREQLQYRVVVVMIMIHER